MKEQGKGKESKGKQKQEGTGAVLAGKVQAARTELLNDLKGYEHTQ